MRPFTDTEMGRICYALNRQLQAELGEAPGENLEEIDPAGWRWRAIEESVRRARNGASPEECHNEVWLPARLRNGWRWGSVKDSKLKTHPACRPWAELTEEQKSHARMLQHTVTGLVVLVEPVRRSANEPGGMASGFSCKRCGASAPSFPALEHRPDCSLKRGIPV